MLPAAKVIQGIVSFRCIRRIANRLDGDLTHIKLAVVNQLLAMQEAILVVHVEQSHGATPTRCVADNVTVTNGEVLMPRHGAWIEDIDLLTSLGVDRR
jgi:hypothetical protein